MTSLKSLLKENRVLVGLTTQHIVAPWLAKLYKYAGADFVYVEHLRGRELARSRRPTSAQRSTLTQSPETACHCPVAGEYNSGAGAWPNGAQLNGTHGRSSGSRADGCTG